MSYQTVNQSRETPRPLDYNSEWTLCLCSASCGAGCRLVWVKYLFDPFNVEVSRGVVPKSFIVRIQKSLRYRLKVCVQALRYYITWPQTQEAKIAMHTGRRWKESKSGRIAAWVFLWGGGPAPHYQLRGLGKAVSSPSGLGMSPSQIEFSYNLWRAQFTWPLVVTIFTLFWFCVVKPSCTLHN